MLFSTLHWCQGHHKRRTTAFQNPSTMSAFHYGEISSHQALQMTPMTADINLFQVPSLNPQGHLMSEWGRQRNS